MPTYHVDVGNQTYEVDAPDPNTAWAWANHTAQSAPAPAPKPPEAGFLETVGANLAGGFGSQLLGAGAAAADYTGASDTAKYLDEKRKAVEEFQQRHGGDTTTGRIAAGVGSMAPALAEVAAAPFTGGSSLVGLVANAGLFAIPGFRDTYKAQTDAGASPTVAAEHALADAGLMMVGGKLVSAGGKALPTSLQAGEKLLPQVASAAGEGAAFTAANTAINKGIDVANNRDTDASYFDPRGMAESAASFGILRAGHHALTAPQRAAAAQAKAQADADEAAKNAPPAPETPPAVPETPAVEPAVTPALGSREELTQRIATLDARPNSKARNSARKRAREALAALDAQETPAAEPAAFAPETNEDISARLNETPPEIQDANTQPPEVQPTVRARGRKRSVAVPVQPTEPTGAAEGAATPTGAPEEPSGQRLVSAEQPANAGNAPEIAQPSALAELPSLPPPPVHPDELLKPKTPVSETPATPAAPVEPKATTPATAAPVTPKPLPKPPEVTEATRATATAEVPKVVETVAAEGETPEEKSKRELQLEADRQARSAALKAQREAQLDVTRDEVAKAVRETPDEPLKPEHADAIDEIDAKLNLYDTSDEVVKAQRAAAYIDTVAKNPLAPMAVRQYAQHIVDSQLDPKDVEAGRKKAGEKGVLYSTENAEDRPLPDDVIAHIRARSAPNAIDALAKTLEKGSVEYAVAQRVWKLLGNTDIKIVDNLKGDEGQDVRGLSTADGDLIRLDSKRGLNVETLLHEAVHAASEHILRQDPKEWTPQQAAAVDELKAIWEAAKRDKSIEMSEHARDKLSEFVTEAMTNKDLQEHLQAKPWQMKNAWDWFKRGMLKMLGVEHPKVMQDSIIAAMDTLFKAPPEYTKSAAGMFDKAALDAVSTTGRKSRYKTIEMAIDDFLALADRIPPEAASTVKADGVRELMRSGTKFSSIPYLYVSADGDTLKAIGHEGRNRAAALKAAGFETMPVELRDTKTYRWSEQADPDNFDYHETWPTRIEAQEDALNPKFSIPMPFTREESPKNYVNPTESIPMATTAKKAAPVAAPKGPGTPGPTISERAKNLTPPPTGVKAAITGTVQGAKKALSAPIGIDLVDKVRTQLVDKYAAVTQRLAQKYSQGVRDAAGKVNAVTVARQSEDLSRMLPMFFSEGGAQINSLGLIETFKLKDKNGKEVSLDAVYKDLIPAYAKAKGLDFETANAEASTILEGMRVAELVKGNATGQNDALIHWRDSNNQIDTVRIAEAVREYNASPELKEMSHVMDTMRLDLLSKLEASGRLTAQDAKFYSEALHYVPFDRLNTFDEKFTSRKRLSGNGIAQMRDVPKLIGSEVRPVGNVFENYSKTMAWLLQSYAKQNASTELIKAMESVGAAKKLPGTIPSKTGFEVPIFEQGGKVRYEVPSEYDQAAFVDTPRQIPAYVRFLSGPSKLLRLLVTANPAFALSQVVQDTQGALLTSGVKSPAGFTTAAFGNFAKLTWHEMKGLAADWSGKAYAEHPFETEFGRTGLAGDVDYSAPAPATEIMYRLGVRQRSAVGALIHRLERITHNSDLAVRKAVYDYTLKETTSAAYPLGDTLLANTRARELINFHRRGTSGTMQDLITTVPFLNATAQSMDILYRNFAGKDSTMGIEASAARKQFLTHLTIYAGAAMAYAMAKAGDEEYENLDRRTRDNNWILGGGVKIAIRGDISAIKVAIENAVGYYRRQGTPEEQLASEMVLTTLQYAREQYVGRINIIPTAIRPVVENMFNYSTLTGRPLEGTYQQLMLPHERTSKGTSELSKSIAEYLSTAGIEVSPIKIDNAVKGYFGTSAAATMMLTDAMLHPDAVDRPMSKWIGISGFMYDTSNLTNPKDEFYDLRAKVMPVQKTLQDISKTDVNKAFEFAQDHAEELALSKSVMHTLESLSKLRKYRNWLNGPDAERALSKEDRTEQMNKIQDMENQSTAWVRAAKTQVHDTFKQAAKP